LIGQIQTVAQAKAAVSEGAEFIVAQGTEAGGHGGTRSTRPLIPAVVDAVGNIPVIAAGGIADGRGLAAALMLGAAGVLWGTAFFASRESLSHRNMKQAAFATSGDDTVRSSVVDIARGIDWPAQWTIRTLKNGFTDDGVVISTDFVAALQLSNRNTSKLAKQVIPTSRRSLLGRPSISFIRTKPRVTSSRGFARTRKCCCGARRGS
jgi:NAD(P)H-dependent flavin oxidoreductase YrpB (nitropropane dioxygenase family)